MARRDKPDLMMQAALNRLQFWLDELERAESARNASGTDQCKKFIEEYRLLIENMAKIGPAA
jgi:hypothetical protein